MPVEWNEWVVANVQYMRWMCACLFAALFFSSKRKKATWWQNGNRFLETYETHFSAAAGDGAAAAFIWLVCAFNCERQYINQVCTRECSFSTAAAQCTLTAVIRVLNKWGESRTHTRCYIPEQKNIEMDKSTERNEQMRNKINVFDNKRWNCNTLELVLVRRGAIISYCCTMHTFFKYFSLNLEYN